MYTHTHAHLCMQTLVHVYTHTHFYTDIPSHTHTDMHMHAHTHTHTQTNTHKHTSVPQIHTHTHTYTHTTVPQIHTHVHTHTHTHTHTYTHARARARIHTLSLFVSNTDTVDTDKKIQRTHQHTNKIQLLKAGVTNTRTQLENEKAEHKTISVLCWPSLLKLKQLKIPPLSLSSLSLSFLPSLLQTRTPPLSLDERGETRKMNPRKIHHSRHLPLFRFAIGCISCIRTKRDNSFFSALPSVSRTAPRLADWSSSFVHSSHVCQCSFNEKSNDQSSCVGSAQRTMEQGE